MAGASFTCLLMIVLWRCVLTCEHYKDPACQDIDPIDGQYFLNQYIVKVKEGDEKEVKNLAEQNNFQYLGTVKDHEDAYILAEPTLPYRHKMKHEETLNSIRSLPSIETADQHFVWQPTLRELQNYRDMTGYEEPTGIKITHFDPSEMKPEINYVYPFKDEDERESLV